MITETPQTPEAAGEGEHGWLLTGDAAVSQWPELTRRINRVALPQPHFIHPWNN